MEKNSFITIVNILFLKNEIKKTQAEIAWIMDFKAGNK
jgi:hypothetical protein